MKLQDDVLKSLISDIESSSLITIKKKPRKINYELQPYLFLFSNLSGWLGALLVRSILFELNINENRVLRWRLENKYIQYIVMNYYAPGCMPMTLSYAMMISKADGCEKISTLFKKGYFLKATLGDGSGRAGTFDRTSEFNDIINVPYEKNPFGENWVLQLKLNLKNEFRVHTFNRDIVSGLTFKITGHSSVSNVKAEEFVSFILGKLPDSILNGTLIAWDIGLTHDNKYYVIESNFTGFHPVYRAGFQTTGYVDNNDFGPVICAWLNNYFKIKYSISISSVEQSLSEMPFFKAFLFYTLIFNETHLDACKNIPQNKSLYAVIYWVEYINSLLIPLIQHLQMVNFAASYYVITNNERLQLTKDLFYQDDKIAVFSENALFNEPDYKAIQRLNYKTRKKKSCHRAISLIGKNPCVII